MAKTNGKKITIAMFVGILAIFTAIGRLVWVQATQSEQLKDVCIEVEEIEPEVDKLDTRVTILEIQQTAIYEGVKRIEGKLDKLP